MQTKIKVRPAQADEFYRIEELAESIRLESRYSAYDLNIDKVEWHFNMQFDTDRCRTFFAVTPEKDIEHTVGFGSYMLHAHYFSDALLASDLMTYVHPLYRGSSAFFRLVKAYENWAAAAGAKEINLATSTGIDTLAVSNMYRRLGYPLTAVTHTKVL